MGAGYAIGGSWASTTYGEPRQTNDTDLVVGFDRQTLTQFLDSLSPAHYRDETSIVGRAASLRADC